MWCDYAPKYDVIRQLLEDGALGDLHTLLADHGEYFTRDHRIFNADLAGGPMMDLGSYDLVCADGGRHAAGDCRPRQRHGGGLNGQTSMLFSWQNGMQGLFNTTLFSNTPGGRWWPDARDPDDRRPVYAPAASRSPPAGRAGAALGRAAQSLRPAVLAGGAFCPVHRAGVAGLAAAAAQSGAAESAGDG